MSPSLPYALNSCRQTRVACLCTVLLLGLPAVAAARSTGSKPGQAAEAASRDSRPIAKLTSDREALQKALALNPADADAHNGLGRVLMELKEYDDAIAEFRASLQLRPNSLPFANDLALALTKMGEIDEAITLYESLIKSHPDSPEILSNYALALWQKSAAERTHNLAPVIAALLRGLQYRPNDPGLHNNIGMALKENGDVAGAIKYLQKAIALRPTYAVARTNLAAALRMAGRNEDALHEVRTAISHKSDYAEAHYELGNLMRDSGDLESAAKQFRWTIALKSDYTEAYYGLATVLKRLGLTKEAAAALEKFQTLSQASRSTYEARLHNSKGLQAVAAGDLDRAIEEFSSAIRNNGQSAAVHNNLGWALVRKQDLPGAIREFRQAILLNDKYAIAYRNLGLALWSTGQKQDAKEALLKANRLDPGLILPKFVADLEKKEE